MKTNILITGPPGIGKTTLVKKIVDHLKSQGIECTGFYTEEVRNNNIRVGFDVVTLSGERGVLAKKGSNFETNKPKVGQYEVNIGDFEKLALPVFQSHGEVVIIDEIGKMELFSKKFEFAVRAIFKNKNLQIVATVPFKGRFNIVEELKQNENSKLFAVNFNNRNTILNEILQVLSSR